MYINGKHHDPANGTDYITYNKSLEQLRFMLNQYFHTKLAVHNAFTAIRITQDGDGNDVWHVTTSNHWTLYQENTTHTLFCRHGERLDQ